jgi:hypothetical protein
MSFKPMPAGCAGGLLFFLQAMKKRANNARVMDLRIMLSLKYILLGTKTMPEYAF